VAADQPSVVRLEIGHVLFIDIVGYSKLLINEQSDLVRKLKEIVRGTEQVRVAESEGKLVQLPTGDGMALVFRNSVEAPVLCALEISEALKDHPELRVRMGIHSGPVNEVTDVNERANIAGAGINIAQRVMDCGDAGHILLSKHVAEDLEHYAHWQPYLHDLGQCQVKHGVVISIVNLYTTDLGNAQPPQRFKFRKKTRVAALARPTTNRPLKPILFAVAVLVILATSALLFFLRSRSPALKGATNDRSIAVLPFENLSDDKQNAYFADGVQDEILTRLAKIGALKVISRASTQRYQAKPGNLPEIARQLGVAHILEGSVQKAGNAVHINVQLIRAATDDHIWAESFDRKLDDIFSVEGEVAGNIASALNTKLTGNEQQLLTEKLTNNPAAYDAYLRGLAMEPRGWYSAEAKQAFRRLYAEATRLDPKFVAAWARLARTDAWMVFLGEDATQERRDAAKYALDTAIQLQPDSTDTMLAQAYSYYWLLRDYPTAKTLFMQLRAHLPNSSEVLAALSLVARRQGSWDESLDYSQRALTLNPRDPQLLVDRAWTYAILRRFDEALRTSDRLLEISPNDPDAIAYRAAIFHAQGNMAEARRLFSAIKPDVTNDSLTGILIQHWLLDRDYQKLIETLQPALADLGISAMRRALYREAIGFAQLRAGDDIGAKNTLLQARRDLEILRERDMKSPEIAAHLGAVYGYLGEKEAGLERAEHAITLLTAAQDAVLGPALEEDLARVETEIGQKDRAIARLQKLLNTPYSSVGHGGPITPALLRLHPFWDPLRGDQRFEAIVMSGAPNED
jgi:TolB-like protein